MAIISENDSQKTRHHGSSQFRYAIIYMVITLAVLIFLNIYCSKTSQKLFYQSKETSMIEKCQLAAAEISKLGVLNPSTVSDAIAQMDSLRVTRLIVTNQSGVAVYDSYTEKSALGSFVLFPEIVCAMKRYDVFSWQYRYLEGMMESRAATPIVSYGTTIGCVYMMEQDREQGALIKSLQHNVLSITLVLELVVILFSVAFATGFSRRLRRIVASMRIIREGDYSHRVDMGGNDELTTLGEEFNALSDRLQISENKRRQFVSDASHELKTPLASIKLLSDSILQNDMDLDTAREFVEDIGNEADRLNRMTLKLLTLSKIESQEDGDCEIVYMAPTIQKVVRMLSGIAEKSQITIELDVQQDCPILILEDDLYQIAFNLVENGIKYNTPGGRLTISLLRDGENAVMRVSDTGVGISEDALSHIFERFYRVDKARSRKSGGSGLGLAIVKNTVERNQGRICADSNLGEGTTFTVTFPAFDPGEEDK